MVDYKLLLSVEFHLAQAKLYLHSSKPEMAVKELEAMILATKRAIAE